MGLGCVAALKEAAGEEILANAAGVVALFSAMTIVVDVPCHHLGFEKVFCTAGPQKKLSGRYVILYVYINIFIIYLYRRSQGRIKVGRNDLFKNTCWS